MNIITLGIDLAKNIFAVGNDDIAKAKAMCELPQERHLAGLLSPARPDRPTQKGTTRR